MLSVLLACFRHYCSSRNLTILHTFKSKREGVHPVGRLITDEAGNLYGNIFGRRPRTKL